MVLLGRLLLQLSRGAAGKAAAGAMNVAGKAAAGALNGAGGLLPLRSATMLGILVLRAWCYELPLHRPWCWGMSVPQC